MHGLEAHLLHAQPQSQALQLTVGAARAGWAALIVIGEQQFHRDLANLSNLRRRGQNLQARLRRRGTCALDSAPFNLHQAQAARAIDAEFGVIAECGQVDVGLANKLEQIALAFDQHCFSIDRQSWLSDLVHLAISLRPHEFCRLLRRRHT